MKRKRPLKAIKKDAWAACSRYVRQSAADYREMASCYTCGVTRHWKELQAGHAIPGRHGAVLFDLEIIRPQCYRCNVPMRGMHHIFAAKLIKEHGLEWWERKELESHGTVRFRRDDYEKLIEKFS